MYIPKRMCVSCRERHDKKDLIRLSLSSQNEIVVDNDKQNKSRAIYVCKNEKCISKLEKLKVLEKNYKSNIDKDFYNQLINLI